MNRDKLFAETVRHIYSRTRRKINPSLDNTRRLLRQLGEPQQGYTVFQVIGTNGKGSAARMLSALLEMEGEKTGLFTSPHLVSPLERIQVGGRLLAPDTFLELWDMLKPHAQALEATFFEVFTLLAVLAFQREKVSAGVFEAGLGGSWDSTTALGAGHVLLTSVQLDHQRRLGTTREAIARDKAGALTPGSVCVCGESDPAVRAAVARVARERNAELVFPEDLVVVERVETNLQETVVEWHLTDAPTGTMRALLPYRGRFQLSNLRTALAAYYVERGWWPLECTVDFRPWPWPGRFQTLNEDPLLIVDTAHNPDAARALFTTLREYYPERKPVAYYGTMADKDWRGYLRVIREFTDQLIPAALADPRALPYRELWNGAAELFPLEESPLPADESWDRFFRLGNSQNVLVVCGSFHTVEIAFRRLGRSPFPEES
jgi:dihydrofolate synthase/folylpolyglutamate synthase